MYSFCIFINLADLVSNLSHGSAKVWIDTLWVETIVSSIRPYGKRYIFVYREKKKSQWNLSRRCLVSFCPCKIIDHCHRKLIL